MRLLTTILIVLLGIQVNAQKRIKISGVVSDSDGNPLELVNVRLSTGLIGTATDLKGRYELNVTPKDSLMILFTSLGYKKVSRLLLKPQSDVRLNVKLYSNDEALGEVVVVQHRKQNNTLQMIDAGKTKLLPDASGNGVEGLLTTIAGVNSSNELSSQYSVRGGNFDENIVYVNGIEVYRPLLIRSGQQEGLSFINPDMVGSINFSSGGYGAEYGDKMASVLDITYKKPKPFEASLSLSLMGGSVAVGQTTGPFSQLHGIRYKRNSSLLSTLDTKGEYDPTFFDYQTFITYKLNTKWSVGLLGNISQNDYNFIPKERTTSFGTLQDAKKFTVYFDGREKDLFSTLFGALTIDYNGIKNTSLQMLISAFTTDEKETYDITGQYWLDNVDMTGTTGSPQGSLGLGTFHEHARNKLQAQVYALALKGNTNIKEQQLRWGINYQREQIDNRVSEWEMRDSAGYTLPHQANGVNVIYSLHAKHKTESNRFGAYLQDTYRFNSEIGRFSLTGGLRAAYWDFNKELIVSPRAALSLTPKFDDGFTFRFATGIYYQAPFFKEFRDTIRNENGNLIVKLNQNIKSQRSIHFVLGGDYSFNAIGRPFKLSAELYYKKLDNLIPYEVDNVRVWYYAKNMSKGYAAGLDVKFFGEFVPGTDSWISFSLMNTKETINGHRVPRPTEQRYSIALFFNDYVPNYPKYKVSLKAIWSDGLPVSAPRLGREFGVFRTSPYRRVDIGASRILVGGEDRMMTRGVLRYFKSIWLGIDVFNVLNISNVNSYYWVTDLHNQQYAVPNYLTARQFNLRLSAEF